MYVMIDSATRGKENVQHRLTDYFGFWTWNQFFLSYIEFQNLNTIEMKAMVLCSKSQLYNRYLRSNSVV